jgi:hypothetical protein
MLKNLTEAKNNTSYGDVNEERINEKPTLNGQ